VPRPILLALLALVIVAAVFDFKSRRIPNWLTLTGVLCGIGIHCWISQWQGLLVATLGMGLALLIYLPLFALRAVGGGDVKLMAAVGALAGANDWVLIFLITAILGGVVALLLVVAKGRLTKTLRNVGVILNEMAHLRAPHEHHEELDVTSDKALRLPHGCTIAASTLLYLAVHR